MKTGIALSLLAMSLLLACTSKKPSEQEQAGDSSRTVEPAKQPAAIIMEQAEPDSLKGSIKAEAVAKLGDTEIKISYYSPAVRGRIIWGGLVPFDKVWVTGAHTATSVEFNHDLMIGGNIVPAGKYAFFTIPGKKDWTLILNKNWRQHLTDQYDAKQDVLRITVIPETEEKNQERLRYVIEIDSDTAGELVMYWEKMEVSLPFSIQ
ncbi:MAG: DUF2911 domain-containing protein [Cyclobacteriaceae bacterium]|nr:DUF2911 domain-containing protein [Cyclobacteriaceae bacterium]